MVRLAVDRPAFHSEADFQHALAWRIHHDNPDFAIRLESPVLLGSGSRRHIDLLVRDRLRETWMELKYPTKGASFRLSGEEYRIGDHRAIDVGRYSFWEDVVRLEKLVAAAPSLRRTGIAVFLTNDRRYWENGGSGRALDEPFRFYEDVTFHGDLVWAESPGKDLPFPWERHSKGSCLRLRGRYRVRWQDFGSSRRDIPDPFRFFFVSMQQ